MNTILHTIKCGNCHRTHGTVGQVKDCYRGTVTVPAVAEQVQLPPRTSNVGVDGYITQRQFDHLVNDLGQDPLKVGWYTIKWASKQISELRKEREAGPMTQPAPNRVQTIVPIDLLISLPDGYYASQQDETYPTTFFYVSRPKAKNSNFRDAMVIKTIHGEDMKEMLVVYKWATEPRVYVHNKVPENDLLMVAVDPNGAGASYAEKIGRCQKCGKRLTDERSRWFGIGPDCETRFPEVIDMVVDRKGAFVHGWEKR